MAGNNLLAAPYTFPLEVKDFFLTTGTSDFPETALKGILRNNKKKRV